MLLINVDSARIVAELAWFSTSPAIAAYAEDDDVEALPINSPNIAENRRFDEPIEQVWSTVGNTAAPASNVIPVSTPSEVIIGCAGLVTFAAEFADVAVPVRFPTKPLDVEITPVAVIVLASTLPVKLPTKPAEPITDAVNVLAPVIVCVPLI